MHGERDGDESPESPAGGGKPVRMRRSLFGVDINARTTLVRTVASLSVAAAALFLGLAVLAAGGGGEGGGDTGADLPTRVRGTTVENELGPEAAPQVARFEHGAFFTYMPDPADNVAGSATVVVRNEGEVSVTVSGWADGDRAVIRATVENGTGAAVEFPAGLTVLVDIDRDGVPWRSLEPSDGSVIVLPPGEQVTVSTEVALDDYGEYSLSGEVHYRLR